MATDTGRTLAGRRVLLTGAAGAFGSATAAALHARGAAVAGLDIRAGAAARPAGPPAGEPAPYAVRHCDLSDDAAVPAVVAEAAESLGGLDAVVHFAGIGEPVDAGAAPGSAVRRTLEVNLLGPWRVTAAALPELTRSCGRVVYVASELAYATLPFAAAYAASKRGLAAYADAVRLEYGPRIAVTTVYPGYVRTPIHDDVLAAGLSMEGQVRAERVEDVVATVLRALTARRPPRDTAATRLGGVELWLARRMPATVDRAVRLVMARELRRGRYDGAPLARGLAHRYGAPAAGERQPDPPGAGPPVGPAAAPRLPEGGHHDGPNPSSP